MILRTNEREQAACDRANQDPCSVLYMRTTGAVGSIVKKFKPRRGDMCDGIAGWAALKEKFMPSDESNRLTLLHQLDDIVMEEGTDPDISATNVWELTCKMENIGEQLSRT